MEGAIFKLGTASYQTIQVRQGFSKVGSEMFFSAEGFPISVKIGDRSIGNQDSDWQYAKFHWRSSLFLALTLQDHLLGAHLSAANALAVASREVLPARHPLRRLMARYTMGTIKVNLEGVQELTVSNGLLQRATPFADFQAAVQAASDSLPPAKELLAMVTAAPGEQILLEAPFVKDGTQLYQLNEQLVQGFFSDYGWCNSTGRSPGGFADVHVQKFAARVKALLKPEFLDVSETCTDFVQDLQDLTFIVSGFHGHVSNIADVFEDPDMLSMSWREGEAYGPPKQAVLTSLLHHSTSHNRFPTMDDNFTHLCVGLDLEDAGFCKDLFDDFQVRAQTLAAVIEGRNANRTMQVGEVEYPTPYVVMSPSFAETMVAK